MYVHEGAHPELVSGAIERLLPIFVAAVAPDAASRATNVAPNATIAFRPRLAPVPIRA
jgi:hypothetical protein